MKETPITEGYGIFVPNQASPQFLGDVILITTVSPVGQQHVEAEHFVLIEKSSTKLTNALHKGKVRTSGEFRIDSAILNKIALDAARAVVAAEVQKRFEENKDWTVYAAPFMYDKVDSEYLLERWLMGHWHAELKAVQQATRYAPLQQTLATITAFPPLDIVAVK